METVEVTPLDAEMIEAAKRTADALYLDGVHKVASALRTRSGEPCAAELLSLHHLMSARRSRRAKMTRTGTQGLADATYGEHVTQGLRRNCRNRM